MAKLTLLEMTQSILGSMDSDAVTSINDTIEARQIADILKDTYFEMMADKNWPHLRRPATLNNSLDTAKPTEFGVPELVKEIEWITYNMKKTAGDRDRFELVNYMHPDEFLRLANGLDETKANVTRVIHEGMPVNIQNDRAPTNWTNIVDDIVIMDAFNSDLESTLQNSNSQVLSHIEPSWTVQDNFIPDMPAEMFPALLEEARSVSFFDIAQDPNEKAEQKAVRSRNRMYRKSGQTKQGIRFPNFGRQSRKGTLHRNPLFDKQ